MNEKHHGDESTTNTEQGAAIEVTPVPHPEPAHEAHPGLHVHTDLHAGFRGGDIQKGREGWME